VSVEVSVSPQYGMMTYPDDSVQYILMQARGGWQRNPERSRRAQPGAARGGRPRDDAMQ